MSLSARCAVAAASIRNTFSSRAPQLSLLTDFGTGDEAVYAVKSAARAVNPKVNIDDICHNVPIGNVLLGAWRLKRAVELRTEPKSAAYVAVIDPGVGTERRDIVVKIWDGRYLVGPDNGVLSLACSSRGVEGAVEIENLSLTLHHFAHSRTFHGKDVFAPVAAHLLRGVPLQEFGRSLSEAELAKICISAESTEKSRIGHLVDIDGFGSLRTNVPNHIPQNILGKVVPFSLHVAEKSVRDRARVVRAFAEAERNEPVFVLSSTGCLDLAVNLGSAAERYSIRAQDIKVDRELRPASRVVLDLSSARS